ncbi:MAG: hypothetical protein J6A69_07995 [Clostridia bacterium]|nr:hypothetical protein [Clostridia bacterium]
MNLKILFSKSIIKSDFKRYWWISALFTLFLALNYTFVIFTNLLADDYNGRCISVDNISVFFISAIISAVLGALLFSYLQKGKSATFFHALPYSRTTLYFSHILSGLVMYVIPLVVNLFASYLIVKGFDAENLAIRCDIYECIYLSLVYGILFFCMSAFVSGFMGNTFASFLFTYVFYFLPLGIEAFIRGFAEAMLNGFYADTDSILTMNAYFFDEPCTATHIISYAILSIVFLGAGILVYKKRDLENHSEIVAFPKLKMAFIMGSGIVCGAVGYLYFLTINSDFRQTSITFIPFGVIGIIISAMISAKSFKVPKLYKPIGVFLGFVFVMFLFFDMDITGYQSRVPVASDVESVVFEFKGYCNINHTRMYIPPAKDYNTVYFSDKKASLVDKYTPVTTNKETIEKICNLHKNLSEADEPEYRNNDIMITYNLKNGTTLKRVYPADYRYEKEIMEITNSELKSLYIPILRNEKRDYTRLTLLDDGFTPIKVTITPEEINNICSALKKDIENEPVWNLLYSTDNLYTVELEFTKKAVIDDTGEIFDIKSSESYAIYFTYTNTLELLEKYNLIN